MADYIIRFTATLDPNGASNRTIGWPSYDVETRRVLRILDGDVQLAIGKDVARLEAAGVLTELSLRFPL